MGLGYHSNDDWRRRGNRGDCHDHEVAVQAMRSAEYREREGHVYGQSVLHCELCGCMLSYLS